MTRTKFTLAIICKEPNGRFDRIIPFNWKPTPDDVFHCIQRMRDQAAKEGAELVQLKNVALRKVATNETTTFQITSSSETVIL